MILSYIILYCIMFYCIILYYKIYICVCVLFCHFWKFHRGTRVLTHLSLKLVAHVGWCPGWLPRLV